jgi:putative phage-type endonuclease
MSFVFYDIEQNTDEWLDLRKGKFTASSFADLFATSSTAQFKKAISKVVFERLTGESPENFSSQYMDRGHELEPLAVEYYENTTFNDTYNGGFFTDNNYIGASPDRLVNDDGILEVKCPAFNTMIDYLTFGKLPSIYEHQVQGQLWLTNRKWCDFIAFHPKIKPLIIRITPDKTFHKILEDKINECIKLVEAKITHINSL